MVGELSLSTSRLCLYFFSGSWGHLKPRHPVNHLKPRNHSRADNTPSPEHYLNGGVIQFLSTCHISAFSVRLYRSRIFLYLSGFRLHWCSGTHFPTVSELPTLAGASGDLHPLLIFISFLLLGSNPTSLAKSLISRTTPTGVSFPSIAIHFPSSNILSAPLRLSCAPDLSHLGAAGLNSPTQSVAHRFHFLPFILCLFTQANCLQLASLPPSISYMYSSSPVPLPDTLPETLLGKTDLDA